MKLYATTTSERGKPVSKSGNEAVNVRFTKDRIAKFDVIFDGEKLSILRYFDASITTVNYIPQNKD